jgi:hypothetical protein
VGGYLKRNSNIGSGRYRASALSAYHATYVRCPSPEDRLQKRIQNSEYRMAGRAS